MVLNDKVVKNQWRGTLHEVVDSVFDKQVMWARGQRASLEGDQIVYLIALGNHRKGEGRFVIDAIPGRGIYGDVWGI